MNIAIASSVSAAVIGGTLHITTGRSAFHWIARAAILCDAALICAWRVAWRALAVWWQRMPRVLAEVRAEVAR